MTTEPDSPRRVGRGVLAYAGVLVALYLLARHTMGYDDGHAVRYAVLMVCGIAAGRFAGRVLRRR